MARPIKALQKDLDGFSVSRILPHAEARMVGPFVFLDHMGPAHFPAGDGIDVRPHPHIGLATLTYLFEGAMLHRDSLGNYIEILPGDVNWMTAGSGIVHSERETHEVKASAHTMDGLQAWVALPREFAEIEPSFSHVKKAELPTYSFEGVFARLIIGEAFGMSAPIKTYSPMHYLDVIMKAGTSLPRPCPGQETALYLLEGAVMVDEAQMAPGDFWVLEDETTLTASANSRLVLLGGERWAERPHLYWNFVSFDKARIEQAKDDWRAGRFPKIPGDDREYTPLPD